MTEEVDILGSLTVYEFLAIIAPGSFFILTIWSLSIMHNLPEMRLLFDIANPVSTPVLVLVFGLVIHITKIGELLFYRRTFASERGKELAKELERLGWPSLIPLKERMSAPVRQSLDRLDALHSFCCNILVGLAVLFGGSIVWLILRFAGAGSSVDPVLVLVVVAGTSLTGVILYRKGLQFERMASSTTLYYLRLISDCEVSRHRTPD